MTDRERVYILLTVLTAVRPKHLVVEGDCWYSCPKAKSDWSDGSASCNDGEVAADLCTCGADKVNAVIDIALARVAS